MATLLITILPSLLIVTIFCEIGSISRTHQVKLLKYFMLWNYFMFSSILFKYGFR